MNEKCKKYDDMSDVFEYGNISDDEIVKLCNQILLESKDEKNGGIIRMCEQVAASGNTLILYSA